MTKAPSKHQRHTPRREPPRIAGRYLRFATRCIAQSALTPSPALALPATHCTLAPSPALALPAALLSHGAELPEPAQDVVQLPCPRSMFAADMTNENPES
jgi:hypothetical protein